MTSKVHLQSYRNFISQIRLRAATAVLAAGRATGCWRRFGILCMLLAAGITLLPLIATRASAQEAAPTYTVLYNFTGAADGGSLESGLIADSAGNLYGTTYFGGNTSSSCPNGSFGCGVVFKLDPAGTETVLYTFTGGADGANPQAGLIADAAGNLYGTTRFGGNTSSCPNGSSGCGVVFKLDPAGTETVLYTFTGGADGASPIAGLIRDAASNLYGTTLSGGNTSSSCPNGSSGCGVVFKLDPAGTETVLDTFTGGADGALPPAGLIRDAAGNLYGTTLDGGNTSSCGSFGCGVVFKLDPRGQHYRVLYTFSGGADGSNPFAPLVRDAAGNLYGTTGFGGNITSSCGFPFGPSSCGVVFKVDPSGKETVLHAFTGGADGFQPQAGLVRDRAGDLYGATVAGDNSSGCLSGCGVVFRLDPSGKETVLHSFSETDGAGPSGLLLDKGSLYGTANGGGNYGYGVVFKLH